MAEILNSLISSSNNLYSTNLIIFGSWSMLIYEYNNAKNIAESAYVMKSLGMENSLNLYKGGSTALWSEGYKVGPGRGLPNAILFVKNKIIELLNY